MTDITQNLPMLDRLRALDEVSAAKLLAGHDPAQIAEWLGQLPHGQAVEILEEFERPQRQRIVDAAPPEKEVLWLVSHDFPEGSVGRMLESAPAVFLPEMSVADVIAALREVVQRRTVVYVFVVDSERHLLGVVAFRELVFAAADQRLGDIMLADPFMLGPEQPLEEAMREVVTRHYPVYPVCDQRGRLIGEVRGQTLFQQQAFEISAQAGTMVGVEKEERLATPWTRSFRFRHPWLQINLLSVFVSAAVVGLFQDVIDRVVVLAMFLPVMAGQSGNLGSQTMAVTLRGMTLGEVDDHTKQWLVSKEAWMGLLNGLITGAVAAIAMYFIAREQMPDQALTLALITLSALGLSCVLSGVAGVLIPLILKRFGFDPATASTIFLTTLTDVFSMGSFLGLAAWLLA
ncbi:MAG: magnesium transporter [Xanthomonadales bacterium]|nr:magnesium transporter [Xanthomonadales bacterium]